jgi:hypothetical protein
MDNRSLATGRSLRKKGQMVAGLSRAAGQMVAGLSRAAGPALERLTPYRISDRFAVESVIGLPWNQ